MGIPKPAGFGVLADNQVVSVLTEEQVRTALEKFDAMKNTYEASRSDK